MRYHSFAGISLARPFARTPFCNLSATQMLGRGLHEVGPAGTGWERRQAGPDAREAPCYAPLMRLALAILIAVVLLIAGCGILASPQGAS